MKKSPGPEWCSVPPTRPAPVGQASPGLQYLASPAVSTQTEVSCSSLRGVRGTEAPFLWVPGEGPTEGGRGCGRRRCPVRGAEGCYSHCLTTTCLCYRLNIEAGTLRVRVHFNCQSLL